MDGRDQERPADGEALDDATKTSTDRTHAALAPPGVDVSRTGLPPRDAIGQGTILAGRYRVFDTAAGGMGRVYLADDLRIERDGTSLKVAIKTVADFAEWNDGRSSRNRPSDVAAYAALLARFRREALTWVKLGMHPNIIWAMWVLDLGAKPYLVMEYADGGDLRNLMRGRRPSVPLSLNLALQFCEGMQHAVRTANVVHRDIKPANVLLTSDGVLKIADFGLARAFDGEIDPSDPGVPSEDPTLSDIAAGTPAYMAPEQFRSLGHADTRSDVFAFGVMFYELLTGVQLFVEHNAAMRAALSLPIAPAHDVEPAVPVALSEAVARCLHFDPERRFQSFAALAGVLRNIHAQLPGRADLPVDASHERRAPLLTRSLQLLGETYALISLGRPREAAARAAEAIDLDPANHEHWINKGKALADLRDFAGARSCWSRAAELKPDDARTWSNLAWADLELGRPRDGRNGAVHAIELDPSFADAWMARGAAERALGELADAVVSLARAARLEPHNWKAHLNLAYCLQDLNRHDEALDSLDRALRINPDDANGWLQVGWLQTRRGAWHEARTALDRSLQLNPENAGVWALRAWALWCQGSDRAEARASLRRALEIDPRNPQASIVARQMSGGV